MENQYQKVVSISYLLFSALVAFILLDLFMKISSTYDLESRIKSIEYVIRIGSIVLGVVLFLILNKNQTVNQFMNEVAVELLTKVSWPTGKETVSATIVVMITVVLAGVILGMFDSFWAYVLRWVI